MSEDSNFLQKVPKVLLLVYVVVFAIPGTIYELGELWDRRRR